MHDYRLLKKNTPIVFAEKKNDSIAVISSGLPDIYYKSFDINEFIGEQLASVRNIRSNHYFPLCFDFNNRGRGEKSNFDRKNIMVGSFDFMKEGIRYFTAPMLPFYYDGASFSTILDMCNGDKNREEFVNENLEMLGLDVYMSQYDRKGNAYYEFYPNGEIHLAPVFDYEASLDKFDAKKFEYASDFFQFMTIDDYQEMMVKYPHFREILQSYLDVDLVGQLILMARNRKFDITGIDFESYKRYDEVIHKKLEKILK